MAIIWLHSYACCPISRLIPTGTVRILLVLVSASANRYSFHACMNVYIPTETSPGTDVGTRIFHNALKREPPSIITASSNSFGKVLKYPVVIRMAYGSVNIRYVRINAQYVLYSLIVTIRLKYGISSVIGGIAYTATIMVLIVLLPRKLNRLNA